MPKCSCYSWFQLDVYAIMRPSYNGNDCFDVFHFIKRNDFEAPDDFGEDSFFFHLSKFLPNAISCSSRKGDVGIGVNRSEIKFIIQYSHQVSQNKKASKLTHFDSGIFQAQTCLDWSIS